MSNLAEKKCVPCSRGIPPLAADVQEKLLQELEGWKVVSGHHLYKEYQFKNFVQALGFVNSIGAVAEEEGHHPDIALGWGYVKVSIWTHKIDNLTESDFVLAAKLESIPRAGERDKGV